jgi:hypothetical protein
MTRDQTRCRGGNESPEADLFDRLVQDREPVFPEPAWDGQFIFAVKKLLKIIPMIPSGDVERECARLSQSSWSPVPDGVGTPCSPSFVDHRVLPASLFED